MSRQDKKVGNRWLLSWEDSNATIYYNHLYIAGIVPDERLLHLRFFEGNCDTMKTLLFPSMTDPKVVDIYEGR